MKHSFVTCLFSLLFLAGPGAGQGIREAVWAGQFYEARADRLSQQVDNLLAWGEPVPALPSGLAALIVPHAGYVYSGAVAAYAYRLVQGLDIDTVVVIGVGPVGSVHINLARLRGAGTIIAADVDDFRLEMCREYEPNESVNAAKTDPVAEVRRLTGGKGADVVITANASPLAQVQAIEMARKGGCVLLFGGLPKEQSRPGIDTNLIHYNALHVIGTTIFSPRHYATALDLLASDRIDGERFVTHRFQLDRFAEGVELAMQGKVRKAIFLP